MSKITSEPAKRVYKTPEQVFVDLERMQKFNDFTRYSNPRNKFQPNDEEYLRKQALGMIQRVIFNDPATIVYWTDGSKTIVKCGPHDIFEPEKDLAMACMKKMFGNNNAFHSILKEYLPKEDSGCSGETCSLEKYLK